MNRPKVSFVVPCYKLAHLLPQCIDSILSQTYADFEILVMNDRSPDNTDEVANSYNDSRVIHTLNEKNLGHLNNYNKGIGMCRGEFIWLISADDYLRSPEILQKYVTLMEAHPRIGYTICPGFAVKNGQEGALIGVYADSDAVVDGHVFLKKLFDYNFVLAASAMVRRECYEKLGMFPLTADWAGQPVDMGWLGDWYLWCMFALHYDVGYFAEPMVCYRDHDLSMTVAITRKEVIAAAASSDVHMLWMIRNEAEKAGFHELAQDCWLAIGAEYRRQGTSKRYRIASYRLDRRGFERSANHSTESIRERRWIRRDISWGQAIVCERGITLRQQPVFIWPASGRNRNPAQSLWEVPPQLNRCIQADKSPHTRKSSQSNYRADIWEPEESPRANYKAWNNREMSTPAISVIMSVFNGERFLNEAIESILGQSFGDFEFIVINDGSTDQSGTILSSYAKKDNRIRIYSQENRGLIESLNRGCGLAKGKYLARMDADDIAVRNRFQWQFDFLEAHPEVGLLSGAAEFIDTAGKQLCIAPYPCKDHEIQRALTDACVFWHPAVLMRKDVFVAVGGYRRIKGAEDYDLWLRMAECAATANLPQVVLRYRVHPGQVSVTGCREQSLGSELARVAASFRRNGKADPFDAAQEITLAFLTTIGVNESRQQTALARGYLSSIRNLCRSGEYELALDALQVLRSPEFRQSDSWVIADAFLWEAQVYRKQKKLVKSLLSAGRAVAIRPRVLGRPIKILFTWFRGLSRSNSWRLAD